MKTVKKKFEEVVGSTGAGTVRTLTPLMVVKLRKLVGLQRSLYRYTFRQPADRAQRAIDIVAEWLFQLFVSAPQVRRARSPGDQVVLQEDDGELRTPTTYMERIIYESMLYALVANLRESGAHTETEIRAIVSAFRDMFSQDSAEAWRNMQPIAAKSPHALISTARAPRLLPYNTKRRATLQKKISDALVVVRGRVDRNGLFEVRQERATRKLTSGEPTVTSPRVPLQEHAESVVDTGRREIIDAHPDHAQEVIETMHCVNRPNDEQWFKRLLRDRGYEKDEKFERMTKRIEEEEERRRLVRERRLNACEPEEPAVKIRVSLE